MKGRFSKDFAEMLLLKGYTPDEVCRLVGVSCATIYRWRHAPNTSMGEYLQEKELLMHLCEYATENFKDQAPEVVKVVDKFFQNEFSK